MGVSLDHTIVPAVDAEASARWFADLFGLPDPRRFGHFWQVSTANGVDLDFDSHGEGAELALQHYAFLVGEEDFDRIYGEVVERGLEHWADPARRQAGQVNRHDGGRGVYFASNDGHLLEIITRRYGG